VLPQVWLATATIAAVVVVLLTAIPSGPDAGVPRVVFVQGVATVERSGRTSPVSAQLTLQPGDQVSTGVNSTLRLLWPDGTLVTCADTTVMTLVAAAAGKRIDLLAGRVDAEVTPQPPAGSFCIVGGTAEVIVLGTRLTCRVHEHDLHVAVHHGRVDVQRHSDQRRLSLVSGQHLRVPPTGELSVQTEELPSEVGTGLYGQYFDDPNLSVPVFGRIDRQISFDFGYGGSPDPRIAIDTFSIRWTGELQPKVSGRHTILCQVDDGVRVRIGGKLLIQDWRIQKTRWVRAEIDLDAGRRYPIQVEYFQNQEFAKLHLWWQAKGVPQEIIPTQQLFPVKPVGAVDG
jgi:hypothetical protein